MNPFKLGLVKKEEEFCDRKQELADLLQHARNGYKVVLSSPRRFGKSSLVIKTLEHLSKEGFLTAYVDLFPVSSEQDFLERLALGLFKGIGKNLDPRSFIKKAADVFKQIRPTLELTQEGYSFSVQIEKANQKQMLDHLLEGLYQYVKKKKAKACIVLDEFQEITELPTAKKIEGILRSHIQSHQEIAYFFVGSRRRVLQDMFSNKRRPFYKAAFFYPLSEISPDDFVPYIEKRFHETGKKCSHPVAKEIYDLVRGYPYYVQKLASIAWDLAEKECESKTAKQAFQKLVQMESVDFEGVGQGLTPVQKGVLTALSLEPTSQIYAQDYISRHHLSLGGIQKAVKNLINLDLVEKNREGVYQLTDPVMGYWIKEKSLVRI